MRCFIAVTAYSRHIAARLCRFQANVQPEPSIGPQGYEPTGAQAQQIALARIVCAGRPVIVLDEATAHMDPGAAQHAEMRLSKALAGRTVITIGDAPNSLRNSRICR